MEGRIDPPSSLHRLSAEDLADKARSETCLLAHQDDRLAGCIRCAPLSDRMYVGKMAVEPDLQGRGIGAALMQHVEALARAAGLPMLELQTRIELSENYEAFTQMGFSETGRTAHPGFDRPTSRTMAKPL